MIYFSELKNLTDSIKEIILNEYLIGEEDIYDFLNFYLTESVKGNKVVLFRFAKTDYYCSSACQSFENSLNGLTYSKWRITGSELLLTVPSGSANPVDVVLDDTYLAQQTLFLDFDIIELTFTKDGVASVIPVVSSPIDVIGGFSDKNSGGLDLLKIILMVLALILFIVLTINKTYSRKTLTDKPFTITANKNLKSGTSFIPPDLQREIDRYTPESPFYFGGSSPISEHAIQNAFDQAVRKSGVKRIRIHDL